MGHLHRAQKSFYEGYRDVIVETNNLQAFCDHPLVDQSHFQGFSKEGSRYSPNSL